MCMLNVLRNDGILHDSWKFSNLYHVQKLAFFWNNSEIADQKLKLRTNDPAKLLL